MLKEYGLVAGLFVLTITALASQKQIKEEHEHIDGIWGQIAQHPDNFDVDAALAELESPLPEDKYPAPESLKDTQQKERHLFVHRRQAYG